ncbi:hypothetical protein ACFPLB_13345 [Aquamicrobium segne]|uniref:Transcriptional regulator n=1 Tax=Aquamicrobium segne TaxID=469547 RepID=A0ABW0GZ60_9HYPH
MADFVAVLKKTLGGLGETTPEMRARVYDKARTTIAARLAALDPQPPAALVERQKKALEDAIVTVEGEYAPPQPTGDDPLAELESLFSSIDRNKNQPSHAAPSPNVTVTPAPPPSVEAPPVEPVHPVAESAAERTGPEADKPLHAQTRQEPPVDAQTRQEPLGPEFNHDPAPESEPDFGHSPTGGLDETDDADDAFDRLPDIETEQDEEERRSHKGLITALVALAVLAAGGYGAWYNKDAIGDMFASSDSGEPEPTTVTPVEVPPGEDVAAADPSAGPAPVEPAPIEPNGEASQKFTQRLLPSGEETDPGPAGGGSSIGEGSSVVALTTPPPTAAPGAGPSAAQDQNTQSAQSGVAVGQKAIYYEERTNLAQGSAESGNTVWSLVQESPGGDEPPEPAIRAEVQIPGKDVQLRMTIRRNADTTLPASHIIEMIFLTPTDFEGGGIDGLLRIAFKSAEQDAGSPLIGVPAKIADGYFLVALNDTKADEDANMALFRNREWIDIPVIYKSGRRALLTMEKGIPGDKVFDEAIKAWQEKTAE